VYKRSRALHDGVHPLAVTDGSTFDFSDVRGDAKQATLNQRRTRKARARVQLLRYACAGFAQDLGCSLMSIQEANAVIKSEFSIKPTRQQCTSQPIGGAR